MRVFILLILSFSLNAETNKVFVSAKPLNEVLITRNLSANAKVTAVNASMISNEVSSIVDNFYFDIGDEVKQDELLVSLDSSDYKLQYELAKTTSEATAARLKQAELRLTRAKELVQSNHISTDELLARETDVAVFRADSKRLKLSEKIAKRSLDKTQIKAPFSGIITERFVQKGELINKGTPVMKLIDNQNIQIIAQVPEKTAQLLQNADRMMFVSQHKETPVELIKLSQIIDQKTSLQTARLKPLHTVKVGQVGKLVWELKEQMLSADLVIKRNGQLGVFVVENKKAKFVSLPQAQEGRPVAIENPTSLNWQVIVGGRDRLQDGQAIQVK